jgi:hypothetical protein
LTAARGQIENRFMVASKQKTLVAIIVVLVVAAIAGCGGGGGGTPPPSETTVPIPIHSAQTGEDYTLDVWLPPDYATSTASYPVIYATDCEYRFDTLATVLIDRSARGATPAILINICAGTTAQRFNDYALPGAPAYFGFLTLELIPYVEAHYRTNATKRIFSGHSLSGELAMCVLFLDNPAHRYFTSIVSEEGSFWVTSSTMFQSDDYPPAIAMETAMRNASQSLPIDLFMAGDTTANGPLVTYVYDTMVSQQFQDLHLTHTEYPLSHVGMDGPAFSDAMTFIFGD